MYRYTVYTNIVIVSIYNIIYLRHIYHMYSVYIYIYINPGLINP